jgi:hypothetical protein
MAARPASPWAPAARYGDPALAGTDAGLEDLGSGATGTGTPTKAVALDDPALREWHRRWVDSVRAEQIGTFAPGVTAEGRLVHYFNPVELLHDLVDGLWRRTASPQWLRNPGESVVAVHAGAGPNTFGIKFPGEIAMISPRTLVNWLKGIWGPDGMPSRLRIVGCEAGLLSSGVPCDLGHGIDRVVDGLPGLLPAERPVIGRAARQVVADAMASSAELARGGNRVRTGPLRDVLDAELERRWRDDVYSRMGTEGGPPMPQPVGRPLTPAELDRIDERIDRARFNVEPLRAAVHDGPLNRLRMAVDTATRGVIGDQARDRIQEAVERWARDELRSASTPDLIQRLTDAADQEYRTWLMDGVTDRTATQLREALGYGLAREVEPADRALARAAAGAIGDVLAAELDKAFANTLAGQVAAEAGIPVVAPRQLLNVEFTGGYHIHAGSTGQWGRPFFTDSARYGWTTVLPSGQVVAAPAMPAVLAAADDALTLAIEESARQVIRVVDVPAWRRPFARGGLAQTTRALDQAVTRWRAAVAANPPTGVPTADLVARSQALAADLARLPSDMLGAAGTTPEASLALRIQEALRLRKAAELRAGIDELWRRAEAGLLTSTEDEARAILQRAAWPRGTGTKPDDLLAQARTSWQQADVWAAGEIDKATELGAARALRRFAAERAPVDALRIPVDALEEVNARIRAWLAQPVKPKVSELFTSYEAASRALVFEVRAALERMPADALLTGAERRVVRRAKLALGRRHALPAFDPRTISRSSLPFWLDRVSDRDWR